MFHDAGYIPLSFGEREGKRQLLGCPLRSCGGNVEAVVRHKAALKLQVCYVVSYRRRYGRQDLELLVHTKNKTNPHKAFNQHMYVYK